MHPLTKSRRKGEEIGYYNGKYNSHYGRCIRSAAVPPVVRYRKKLPLWAKALFTGAWILLTIFMYRLFFS